MINMYELRVSPCIISIGSIVSKWLPAKDVVDLLYMFPIISTAYRG